MLKFQNKTNHAEDAITAQQQESLQAKEREQLEEFSMITERNYYDPYSAENIMEISDTQYGPFFPFIKNKDITDIDFNGKELWVRYMTNERKKITDPSILEQLNTRFINSFATNVANLVGKNLTPTENSIEAETEDLRISILHESVAVSGTCICIRKVPPVQRITPAKAIKEHYCEEKMLHFFANCIRARMTMVLCGEPCAGKTEFLKFLTRFIPADQKAITVEDTNEIHYRSINPGKDGIELRVNKYFSYEDALAKVLRLNPAWVMLSETRSTESKELVTCWSSGISGLTTLHTDDVRKIPDRILNMMPSRLDAERLENNVYTGLDIGALVDIRMNEKGEQERYISQVAFFYRKNDRNNCEMLVRGGKLMEEDIYIPEEIQNKLDHAGIEDLFYSKELDDMLQEERRKENLYRKGMITA